MKHEIIAHVAYYLDNRIAYIDTLTGPHILKQAASALAGDVQHAYSAKSAGFHGHHAPRFTRLIAQMGTEAHVTLLRF